jgi:hypothetical protein
MIRHNFQDFIYEIASMKDYHHVLKGMGRKGRGVQGMAKKGREAQNFRDGAQRPSILV